MVIGPEPTPGPVPASPAPAGEFVRLGVEEEFHVVDLASRELVAQAPATLERVPAGALREELRRSVVESNSPVWDELTGRREALVASRRLLAGAAETHGL